MDRLCPTSLVVLLLAFISFGCTGQNLEGAWRGPFPFDGAKDCRVRLVNSGKFDLSCQGDPGWVGLGRWDRTDDGLRLDFSVLSRRGVIVSPLPTVEMRMVGEGNRLRLQIEHGDDFIWRRLAP